MTTIAPRLLHPGDLLSIAELRSAALDGEVAAIGASFRYIDAPNSPWMRAAALVTELADARATVCDHAAAWVWGWAPQPAVMATCVSIAARIPSPVRRRLRTREAVIDDDEVETLAGVRVTSRVRTLLDLARHDGAGDPSNVIMQALRSGEVHPDDLRAAIDRRPGIAYVRRARVRFEAAISRC